MRRFDANGHQPNAGLKRLLQQDWMLSDINPRLDRKRLLHPARDDQVAQLLASLGTREKVVVAEHYDVGRDTFEFFHDGLQRPFRIFALLAEGIQTERAELAFERTSPC
jgi:hypothetical protein